MKFKFLIGEPAIAYCTEWSEIEKKTAETERVAPDYETFMLFKALENNVQFEKEIKSARKNLGFPEDGVSWGFYQKYLSRKPDYSKEEFELVSQYLLNSLNESARIIMKMDLHPMISNRLRLIIFAGCITPLYRGIGFYADTAFEDEDEDEIKSLDDIPYGFIENVNIQISKVTSKYELIKYINENWKDIKAYLDKLPEGKEFYISTRDLRIVDLRDSLKMKYKDIADKIVSEFNIDNMSSSINEDSVKTSYMRAKEKISSLARLKKK